MDSVPGMIIRPLFVVRVRGHFVWALTWCIVSGNLMIYYRTAIATTIEIIFHKSNMFITGLLWLGEELSLGAPGIAYLRICWSGFGRARGSWFSLLTKCAQKWRCKLLLFWSGSDLCNWFCRTPNRTERYERCERCGSIPTWGIFKRYCWLLLGGATSGLVFASWEVG